MGDLVNFGPVWYNPHSLANILSLTMVHQVCHVTMDSAADAAMLVHRLDGSIMRFRKYDTGLYVYDVADNNSRSPVTNYCLIHTVDDNESLYSRRDVIGAKRAGDLYIKLLGRPSVIKIKIQLIAFFSQKQLFSKISISI